MAFIKKQKRKLNNIEKWTVGAVTAGKIVTTDELCEYIADSPPAPLRRCAGSTTTTPNANAYTDAKRRIPSGVAFLCFSDLLVRFLRETENCLKNQKIWHR